MNRIIKPITQLSEFIDNYHFIKDVPFVDITPEQVLQRCLAGEYQGRLFILDGEVVGIVIFRAALPFLHIAAIHLKNNTKTFYDDFFNGLKAEGYKHITAVSKHDEAYFKGFSGFEKVWAMYRKEL